MKNLDKFALIFFLSITEIGCAKIESAPDAAVETGTPAELTPGTYMRSCQVQSYSPDNLHVFSSFSESLNFTDNSYAWINIYFNSTDCSGPAYLHNGSEFVDSLTLASSWTKIEPYLVSNIPSNIALFQRVNVETENQAVFEILMYLSDGSVQLLGPGLDLNENSMPTTWGEIETIAGPKLQDALSGQWDPFMPASLNFTNDLDGVPLME